MRGHRGITCISTVAFCLLLLPASAALATHRSGHQEQGKPTHGCAQADENDGDVYDSTCDGSPSQNGQGKGQAKGKPCAGCVGAADNKNPKGQLPNAEEDGNNGYECDGNQGVGKTNPAHSGCEPYSNSAVPGKAKKINAEAVSDVGVEETAVRWSGGALIVALLLLSLGLSGIYSLAIRRR